MMQINVWAVTHADDGCRNTMSEFMGLIRGEYDGKSGGFSPGGERLCHNQPVCVAEQ